jgi:hypothetical protein
MTLSMLLNRSEHPHGEINISPCLRKYQYTHRPYIQRAWTGVSRQWPWGPTQ